MVDSDPEQSQQQDNQIQDEQKSHPHAVRFTVDGEPLEIETNSLTASEILALVGKKPDQWYLVEEIGGEQREFRDPDEEITINDQSAFLAKPRAITIVVDGQPKTVPTRDVSWDEVVDLAFPAERQNQDLTFVVTYSDAAHDKSGLLEQGGTVRVKEKGTSFNVAKHRRS